MALSTGVQFSGTFRRLQARLFHAHRLRLVSTRVYFSNPTNTFVPDRHLPTSRSVRTSNQCRRRQHGLRRNATVARTKPVKPINNVLNWVAVTTAPNRCSCRISPLSVLTYRSSAAYYTQEVSDSTRSSGMWSGWQSSQPHRVRGSNPGRVINLSAFSASDARQICEQFLHRVPLSRWKEKEASRENRHYSTDAVRKRRCQLFVFPKRTLPSVSKQVKYCRFI